MLVVFSSKATESITMFRDAAVELLKLMGATGRVPGAFSAADVPAALARLESSVERLKARSPAETPAPPAGNEDRASDEGREIEREPPVAIAVRAVPLLSVLRRAVAANAAVMWVAK